MCVCLCVRFCFGFAKGLCVLISPTFKDTCRSHSPAFNGSRSPLSTHPSMRTVRIELSFLLSCSDHWSPLSFSTEPTATARTVVLLARGIGCRMTFFPPSSDWCNAVVPPCVSIYVRTVHLKASGSATRSPYTRKVLGEHISICSSQAF